MVDRIGKYQLHELIGQGGFGAVYRATDTRLDRVVALKVLHADLTRDPVALDRFQKEARIAAAFDHPNIVFVHEVDSSEGYYYIAMKYLPGGNLKERVQAGPMPYAEARSVMTRVCAGLQKAHERGWVHRDLKPANILFDAEGQAVITDFGLAKALLLTGGSSSSSTGAIGTPFYRAPELWRGSPPPSPATDVYSLGCILVEMLTGKVLFGGDTPEVVMFKHFIEGPSFIEGWPPVDAPRGLQAVIDKALCKEISGRYLDTQAFLTALFALEPASPPVRKAANQQPASQSSEIAEVHKKQADEYYIKKDYNAALQELSRAIEFNPNEALYFNSRAIALYHLKDYNAAIRDLNRAIELKPNDANYFSQRGSCYHLLRYYNTAIGDLSRAIELNPNNSDYYNYRGNCYYDLKDYNAALQDINRAIELKSNNPVYFDNRGRCYNQLKDYDAAILDLSRAIELQPDNPSYFYNRGNSLYEMGDYSAALRDYTRAIALKPDNPIYFHNRGNSYLYLKQYNAAICDFNRSIELAPDFHGTFYSRGCANYDLGAYSTALEDYNRAIEMNPNDPGYFIGRANCYKMLGNQAAANKDLKRAEALKK